MTFTVPTLLVSLLAAATTATAAVGVSAESVTISLRPSILRWGEAPTISGTVSSGKAEQPVTIQFKQCGLYPVQFRDTAETTTREGGGWSLQVGIPVSGVFRAVSGGAVSPEVPAQQRPYVTLRRRTDGRYDAGVNAKLAFWRKRIAIERFDSRRKAWTVVRTVELTDQGGGGSFVFTASDPFRLNLPKGTTVRATLPLAAARPCYLAGYSASIRT